MNNRSAFILHVSAKIPRTVRQKLNAFLKRIVKVFNENMKFRKVKLTVESLGSYRVTPITAEKNYSEIENEYGEKYPIIGNPPYKNEQTTGELPNKNDKQNP